MHFENNYHPANKEANQISRIEMIDLLKFQQSQLKPSRCTFFDRRYVVRESIVARRVDVCGVGSVGGGVSVVVVGVGGCGGNKK